MKMLFAISMLLLAGCLMTDPKGSGPSGDKPRIEDQDLLAGATSSTNWPAEDVGGKHLGVFPKADSVIVLHFRHFLTPTPLTGRVSLFLFGTVPAIDSVPETTLTFSNTDSVVIPSAIFLKLSASEQDTLQFSVRVEIDTAQCLMLGFIYSRKGRSFSNSPPSLLSELPYPFIGPRYSLKGIVDPKLFNPEVSSHGKIEFCFYIPGTPYFWKVDPDSIVEIGPLPYGAFPVRFMRIIHSGGGVSKDQLEIFQVRLEHFLPPLQSDYFEWKLGDSILTSTTEGSFSIRSKYP
jgi:hypothetical protein